MGIHFSPKKGALRRLKTHIPGTFKPKMSLRSRQIACRVISAHLVLASKKRRYKRIGASEPPSEERLTAAVCGAN